MKEPSGVMAAFVPALMEVIAEIGNLVGDRWAAYVLETRHGVASGEWSYARC